MDHEPWTMNHGLLTVDYELLTMNHGLWTVNRRHFLKVSNEKK